MGQLIDVVYDAEGNVIALGFPAPAHGASVQHESGLQAQAGQTVAQLELPPELTAARHPELSQLKVDVRATPHKLTV